MFGVPKIGNIVRMISFKVQEESISLEELVLHILPNHYKQQRICTFRILNFGTSESSGLWATWTCSAQT